MDGSIARSAWSSMLGRQKLSATFWERENGHDVSRRSGDKRARWRRVGWPWRSHRWVLCGSREGVLGAQNCHWEHETFFVFRTHFVPISYRV